MIEIDSAAKAEQYQALLALLIAPSDGFFLLGDAAQARLEFATAEFTTDIEIALERYISTQKIQL